MDSLIKTKKIETRFFLNNTTHSHTNNLTSANKSHTSHSKTKDRRDMLNTTAPLNLHAGYLPTSSNRDGVGSINNILSSGNTPTATPL